MNIIKELSYITTLNRFNLSLKLDNYEYFYLKCYEKIDLLKSYYITTLKTNESDFIFNKNNHGIYLNTLKPKPDIELITPDKSYVYNTVWLTKPNTMEYDIYINMDDRQNTDNFKSFFLSLIRKEKIKFVINK
jgi:hypothetical protein